MLILLSLRIKVFAKPIDRCKKNLHKTPKKNIPYVSHSWIGVVEYFGNFGTKYGSCSANLQVAGGIVGIIAIQPLYWESKQAHIGRIHIFSVKEWECHCSVRRFSDLLLCCCIHH